MRAMSHQCLLVACLITAGMTPAMAQDSELAPEPVDAAGSVQTRLEASGTRYEIDQDGDFKIVYSWRRESRSQLVFVAGHVEKVGGIAVRQIFAPVARLDDGRLAPDMATTLLRDNSSRILGHWATNDSHLIYVIDIPDDIDAAGLESAISIAAEIADDKEIELAEGEDEF